MPKTILLADDSVTIQKVVGISFANEDVVLLTVDNGDDAVSRAREARPDLVLADVMMPGKDGYEVCEALRADPELRHVPVLLLSGTFEPYDEARAQSAGADGHITKPFEAQALVDQVNALLARTVRTAERAETTGGDTTVLVSGDADPGTDGAFDFFDEEMAQTAPSPPGPAQMLIDDDDDALELEAAVDDEELPALGAVGDDLFEASAGMDTHPPARFGGPQPAESPFEPLSADLDGEAGEDAAIATPALARPVSLPDEAPHSYEESFDFGFADDGPEAGRTPADADRSNEPDEAAVASPSALFGHGREESLDIAPAAVRTQSPAAPAVAESGAPRSPSPLPPPLPEPVAASAPPVAVPVSGPAARAALSEPIQKHLQETLEKIVWEAFGDVTERIVRDVIERVEAVAWEVIPQMTETLIREQIRRLQDDEES